MPMLHNDLQVDSILSPLAYWNENLSSQASQCAMLNVHFIELLKLMSNIMLTISGRDTLRPLDIYFNLYTNRAHDTKYHSGIVE